jgi:ADP-ribose pyrophosphatase
LISRLVDFGVGYNAELYHAFELQDYVAVLVITDKKEVVMVKQFRPACETYTLEFPAGLVDPGEVPRDTVLREMLEETGYVTDIVYDLPPVISDPGRLGNKIHGFIAIGAKKLNEDWLPEPGVEVVVLSSKEFIMHLKNGNINALHMSIVTSALLLNLLSWNRN